VCYGIWGVVTLVAGAAVVLVGKSKLEAVQPLDDVAAQTVQENVEWITKAK
jgi:hypothetical protein